MFNYNKKYNVVLADPPWNIRTTMSCPTFKNDSWNRELEYNTMTDNEIMLLPVKDIIADDAVLFMWVIDSRIGIIEQLFKAWGFEYRCIAFIWHKRSDLNGDMATMTPFTRRSCEYCFLGVRGKHIIKKPYISQFIDAKRRKHSQKPDEIYSRIEAMMGDVPKIELFSRHRRQGWDVFGDQIPDYCQQILCFE